MTSLLIVLVVTGVLAWGDGRQAHGRLRRLSASSGPSSAAPRGGALRRPHPVPQPIPSPLLLELLAALLESGAPPPTALRHLAAALARAGDHRATLLDTLAMNIEQGVTGVAAHESAGSAAAAAPGGRRASRLFRRSSASVAEAGDTSTPPDTALAVLYEAVRMAADAGLPPATLVRRAATEERRRSGAIGRRAIRRLEVLLVLPVGLCLLPAFVLLGVVPVVIDLFGG
jgi:hypothetical protein